MGKKSKEDRSDPDHCYSGQLTTYLYWVMPSKRGNGQDSPIFEKIVAINFSPRLTISVILDHRPARLSQDVLRLFF